MNLCLGRWISRRCPMASKLILDQAIGAHQIDICPRSKRDYSKAATVREPDVDQPVSISHRNRVHVDSAAPSE